MKNNNNKPPLVSTEIREIKKESLNYGKPTKVEMYIVRCSRCKNNPECTTVNVIDGEQVYGTIKEPIVYLWSATCKKCKKEWYFS